jgi:hypothetical protein
MHAVEKRLSIKTFEPDAGILSPEKVGNANETWLTEIGEKFQEMDRKLSTLEKTTRETHVNDIGSLRSQLSLITLGSRGGEYHPTCRVDESHPLQYYFHAVSIRNIYLQKNAMIR